MKIALIAARVFVYLVGAFLIIMAIDCFGTIEGGFWPQLGCFLIQSSPGVILILLAYFLRKHSLIFGGILILAGTVFFFITKMYRNIEDNFVTILTIFIPILLCAIIFIMDYFTKKNKNIE